MDKKDSQQPGASDYNQNKSNSKRKEQKEKSKNKLGIFKNRKSKLAQDKRHSSIDATLSRYRVPNRPEKTQQSHAIRKLVPAPESRDVKTPQTMKIVVHQPEPRVSDANDAADIYLRTHIHQLHRRESLVNLRTHVNLTDIMNVPKKSIESEKRTSTVSDRWRTCIESASSCTCILHGSAREPKSDWAVLTQPSRIISRTYKSPRFQWFIDLEKSTKVDKQRLSSMKDDTEKDLMALPFIWKKDRTSIDYYLKN
ncbi:unnamed protein product [Chironomus riparius]|uniref:Uncharacterized protein n=1 Tax=Chironomus riparius TaxID=315576 RepID=A0A9N9S073_9DIPT|nr:unnamed protein product [Chironomus riparius]